MRISDWSSDVCASDLVPLVKRVAAVPGDTVCARGNAVFIDGNLRARRRLSDGQSRLMPWWQGCTTLRDGSLFLLNDNPASFDGRYIGPTQRGDIVGQDRKSTRLNSSH